MDNTVTIRRLKNIEQDYGLLEKWCQKSEIYLQFEQRILTYDEIKNKYYPRTKNDSKISVFMIEYNHNPVGIIQYQQIDDENKRLYNIYSNNCYEIDIFIGETKLHNKGIGRKSITLLSNYLFDNKNANLLVMCPLKNNYNAIKCYENCGFIKQKEFTTNNTIGESQTYVMMVKNQ